MSNLADEFDRLKKDVENATRERDRVVGGREEVLKTILAKFGCKTYDDAKALFAKLAKRRDAKKAAFLERKAEFDKWLESRKK